MKNPITKREKETSVTEIEVQKKIASVLTDLQ